MTSHARFIVKYAGGPAEIGLETRSKVIIGLRNDAVEIESNVRSKDPYRTFPVSELRHVTYEDVGTKSNVGAIALFGVLGLGARKSWTLITIGLKSGDAQFLCRAPVHEIRRQMQSVLEVCPSLPGKLNEGPRRVQLENATHPTPQQMLSLTDELERVVSMFERGLLSDEEFRSMKQEIISRAADPTPSD